MLPANLQSVAVTEQEHKFLSEQLPAYGNTIQHINDLQQRRVLVTGIPLKLRSLREKKQLIRNFDQCVEWYNQWVDKNDIVTLSKRINGGTLGLQERVDHYNHNIQYLAG
jgi:hypothetical protein